jgi:heme/copper-type cytochrome/quinol oxidase subunit 2
VLLFYIRADSAISPWLLISACKTIIIIIIIMVVVMVVVVVVLVVVVVIVYYGKYCRIVSHSSKQPSSCREGIWRHSTPVTG